MPDVVSPEVRSRMMSGIRGKNTKPELLLRRELHRRGLRFRLHDKRLPGSPDLVFPKFKAVVFVNGCFWHGHVGCRYFKIPQTRRDFWLAKITRNQKRDVEVRAALSELGWRVATVWECATRKDAFSCVAAVESWLADGGAEGAFEAQGPGTSGR
ncbi:very short patch repair endonuclease [Nocardioides jejuensis]|uniref:Very short patch repair endonuclease n=1 Tax=Nocardioides jejuensis TaxID=2502782 RepID=A0A4R1CGF1_9ACTN|nr:very short patch repair endonuclease [Nocardioides jejuensis]TCJ30424.1 DNA mismatch endonuclease Vsr [Nocardioides jejuensis]